MHLRLHNNWTCYDRSSDQQSFKADGPLVEFASKAKAHGQVVDSSLVTMVLFSVCILFVDWILRVIVSPDKSWGYYAFVIVMLLPTPPQRFLVCALHPAVQIQFFFKFGSNVSCTKVKTPINFGTLRFHLWPPGAKFVCFPCTL